jgi:hypothetical protein
MAVNNIATPNIIRPIVANIAFIVFTYISKLINLIKNITLDNFSQI